MGIESYVKVAGAWRTVTGMPVKVAGQWRTATDHYVKVNGRWRPNPEEPPLPGPGPGYYQLSATSLYLPDPGTTGYAEFNTTEYRGSISEIYSVISWGSPLIVGITLTASGRPNNNYYRSYSLTQDWDNRTISHRIDTFDASSLTDFNSGAAIGFNFGGDSNIIGRYMKNVQLGLTIS